MTYPLSTNVASSSQTVLKDLPQRNPHSQSVFNTLQAAQYLNTSSTFLAKLRAHGKGPPYLKIQSAIRYRITDIDAWLAQQVIKPGAKLLGSDSGNETD